MFIILVIVFVLLIPGYIYGLQLIFQTGSLLFPSGTRKFEPYINRSDAICLKCGHIKTLPGSSARQYDIVTEDDHKAPALRICPRCKSRGSDGENEADFLILNSAHLYYGMRSDLHPLGEMGYVSECIKKGVRWESELPEVAKLRDKKRAELSRH